MRIAPQGFRYIGLAFVLGGAIFVLAPPGLRWLGWPFVGVGAFVAFFFRDPARFAPEDPKLLVSPGDGRIVEVGPAPSAPGCHRVSMFLSLFDVHINRSPLTAVVDEIRYTPGKFFAAYRKEAAVENERNELALSDGSYRVTVRQIAGVVARRIVCNVKVRDRLERAQRFGLIQFGSRMEVVFPGDTEILVKVGDRVRGGETPIARRA